MCNFTSVIIALPKRYNFSSKKRSDLKITIMHIKKYCITLILLLFGVGVAHSQESRTEICIDFRVNSTVIDSAYSDNAVRMQEMVE